MKVKFFSLFLIGLFIFSFCLPALGQEEDYALVWRIKGRVLVLKKGESKWIGAEPAMELSVKDRIKTGGLGSYAEISFSGDAGQIVKIFSNTEIIISWYIHKYKFYT